MNRVATKPISSSIFPSRGKGLLGWLEVTGSSKVTWLAGDEKRLDGATGQAAGAVVVLRHGRAGRFRRPGVRRT